MALPRQKTNVSCFKCKFYAPENAIAFQGKCAKNAPVGDNGVFTTGPAAIGARIVSPSITWCGDFTLWTGVARAEGVTPYNTPGIPFMDPDHKHQAYEPV